MVKINLKKEKIWVLVCALYSNGPKVNSPSAMFIVLMCPLLSTECLVYLQ